VRNPSIGEFNVHPPLAITFAIIGVIALPAVFAVLGHLSSGRVSILVRLAYSSALITILWIVALLFARDIPGGAAVFSSFCVLGTGAIMLYIFTTFLAYSFRLESLLTIARHKHIRTHELAESFGAGAGLSALFAGRMRVLRLVKAVRQVGDDGLQITPIGRALAVAYRGIGRLWHIETI
jgi:hypothetical protein